MCGSLRLEKQQNINPVGSRIPVRFLEAKGKCESYIWDGWARSDGSRDGSKSMADQWDSKEWKITLVRVDSFTERDQARNIHTFDRGRTIRIGALISDKQQVLKIITRPARTDTEISIHNRMPSQVPADMSSMSYTKALNEKTGGTFQLAREEV